MLFSASDSEVKLCFAILLDDSAPFVFRAFFRLHDPKVPAPYVTCGCDHRGGRRLMGTGSSHRASASSSCSSRAGPPRTSSRRELAPARCAATASSPDHRSSQAARAAGRSTAGVDSSRCRASKCKKSAASAPKQPLTSRTTSQQRQSG